MLVKYFLAMILSDFNETWNRVLGGLQKNLRRKKMHVFQHLKQCCPNKLGNRP
jgi:hypothetical protein